MSENLAPTLTRAGLAALRNAQGTGLLAAIDRIAVGRGVAGPNGYTGYAVTGRETALRGEMARVPILQGANLGGVNGSDPLGFRVLVEVPPLVPPVASYPVNEVGFFLSDGTLLALWSDPAEVLHFMTQHAAFRQAFDLFLSSLPTASITVTVQRPEIPDMAGVLAGLLRVQTNQFIASLGMNERMLNNKI